MSELPDFLQQGEPARLIPAVSDTSIEQRVTSTLLSVISVVEEFGKALLGDIGAPSGKLSRIQCFTEVVFKKQAQHVKLRPDGLIVVRTGKRVWTAIVEAKVRRSTLEREQVEAYLDIARQVGVDAVVTISNQFAAHPSQSPLSIDKRKLSRVSLYHWSWTMLLTQALLCEKGAVEDPEQAYILSEMIRYLEHDGSGVMSYERMPASWKDLCDSVQHGGRLSRASPAVEEAVASWHELVRFLTLRMSAATGRPVSTYLSRQHFKNPEKRIQDETTALTKDQQLSAQFEVPDAAARISFNAHLDLRNLTTSMVLEAPKDKKQARARCNWIFKQIEDCPDEQIKVVAKWPGSSRDTVATLGQLREDVRVLVKDGVGVPHSFEIRQTSDLGGRFRGAKTFVEECLSAVPTFYENVGQRLRAWVPKPPQIRPKQETGPSDQIEAQSANGSTEGGGTGSGL